jgi:hypothetical protein
MPKPKLPVEARRAGNLKLIHDSISFVMWDLDDFLENRALYYEIDHKRAAEIDNDLYWMVCRIMGDHKLATWVAAGKPPPAVITARTQGVDTFAE